MLLFSKQILLNKLFVLINCIYNSENDIKKPIGNFHGRGSFSLTRIPDQIKGRVVDLGIKTDWTYNLLDTELIIISIVALELSSAACKRSKIYRHCVGHTAEVHQRLTLRNVLEKSVGSASWDTWPPR